VGRLIAVPSQKGVALYHVMKACESFEETAHQLWAIVHAAIAKLPGEPRHLYFDVDGHRGQHHGFDLDAYELQAHFIPEKLCPYLTSFRHWTNDRTQREDLPAELHIEATGR
jgi:hypothetical protein